MKYIKIFFTGFMYVFMVACNTYFIAKENLIMSFIASNMIGIIWIHNVNKVSVGNFYTKLFYCVGSGLGSVLAIIFSKKMASLLAYA